MQLSLALSLLDNHTGVLLCFKECCYDQPVLTGSIVICAYADIMRSGNCLKLYLKMVVYDNFEHNVAEYQLNKKKH